MPDSRPTKFSAVRSPASTARAGPEIVSTCCACGDGGAVAAIGLNVDIRRQFPKRRNRQRQSGDHAGLARHQDGAGRRRLPEWSRSR